MLDVIINLLLWCIFIHFHCLRLHLLFCAPKTKNFVFSVAGLSAVAVFLNLHDCVE